MGGGGGEEIAGRIFVGDSQNRKKRKRKPFGQCVKGSRGMSHSPFPKA